MVGLGPGDVGLDDSAGRRELAAATDLIGYGPYLDRVRARDGQVHHPSDNTDEAARARLACTLANRAAPSPWSRRATPASSRWRRPCSRRPSSGRASTVRVIPAMTAAQAVASRVGAPLGHDYAVISLSDRLKPWDVIATRLARGGRGRPGAGRSTTRHRRPARGRSPRCATCCSSTASPARRWSSAATCRAAGARQGGAAGRSRSRRRRHALPAHRRFVADAVAAPTSRAIASTRRGDTRDDDARADGCQRSLTAVRTAD